ncbi:MAG: hypothetical protein HGA75_10400 [Thiobacillus sp.]|nr:hypothetical protein [Thiobacillus sp.]
MANIAIKVHNTHHYMSTVPAMPKIAVQAVVTGAPPQAKLEFTWSFKLEYNSFIATTGARRRNVRTKVHPPMTAQKGNPVVVPLSTLMCGKLTVTVETSLNGQKLSASRDDIFVGGTNPSVAELHGAVNQRVVRKMIQQESGGKQFSDNFNGMWSAHALNPNWSSDNLRGVGLGQLTNPPPLDEDIWNWRKNASHLQQRYSAKRASAATLHTRIASSQRYKDEAKALSDWRKAEGLSPLTITLPALDSDQQDREGLRAYNGFGIRVAGQYLDYIHEFEPATTVVTSSKRKGSNGQPLKSSLVLDVDSTGHVKWVQISGAERLRRYGGVKHGEPDYVARVLAQPD